ncbi:MAG: M20/M25/M40 family metallo-hydrolase [Actinomycetota bacterium]|nr:M20/M25/M40 family metallo-hydrolase [Actinomycetota bacterium]
MTTLEPDQLVADHVAGAWHDDVLREICDYIAIPNVSKAYEPDWKSLGHMDRAVEHIRRWCAAREIAGLTIDVVELAGLTPLLVMEIPPFGAGSRHGEDDTVLLYGHLDKQPEMEGWREGLGPWTPVIEGDRLYGRGGADDGYSAYASLLAVEAAQRAGWSHGRLVILIEASEESGSPDLPAYLDHLGERIGSPSLVICLDSGCLDDNRLWVTTSLRGLVSATLRVDILTEGVHSGEASGIVPSSFRILRSLLDRLEDATTGRVLIDDMHVEIPADRRREAEQTSAEFPDPLSSHYPFVDDARPTVDDPVEQILAHTWRPTLSYVGADGLPSVARGGNVLRPYTSLSLSFRLPPTCDPDRALTALRNALTADVPYQARVTISNAHSAPGWNAPTFEPWLVEALENASNAAFGASWRAFGEGGTIPFMGMLGEKFPQAQFVITGVLGPGSNAHGPNEFLHIPTGRKVTIAMAHILRDHAHR